MKVKFYISFDVKIILKSHSCCKNVIISHFVGDIVLDFITVPENLSILLHDVIPLPDVTSYDK